MQMVCHTTADAFQTLLSSSFSTCPYLESCAAITGKTQAAEELSHESRREGKKKEIQMMEKKRKKLTGIMKE